LTAPSENRLGILTMCAAMALFVTNDALLKLATTTLPPGQIMTVRGVFASMLALGLVLALRESTGLRGLRQPMVLARAGHFPWVDEPAAFRAVVDPFLR